MPGGNPPAPDRPKTPPNLGSRLSTAAGDAPGRASRASGATMTARTARIGPAAATPMATPRQEPAASSAAGDDRPRAPTPAPRPPVAGAVSLWLDTYEDIFSDFDPRPYAHRALSEDFLAEARRAVLDRRDDVPELLFLVPTDARSLDDEAIIRRRLRDHFRRHADRLTRERRRGVWGSLAIATAGLAVMTGSALLRRQGETVTRTVLHVLLEPAGWFAVWFGLDQLFYGMRELAREHAFYRKMARADVVFAAYVEAESTNRGSKRS